MPVEEIVVGERRMVGDVLQIIEDLLTGGVNDDRHCHGIHGHASLDAAPLGRC